MHRGPRNSPTAAGRGQRHFDLSAGDTNRRRSADRAAIAARSPTDSIADTPPFHLVHPFYSPEVNPRPYGYSHGCSLGFDRFRHGRLESRSLVYVSKALLTLGVLFCSISEILLPLNWVSSVQWDVSALTTACFRMQCKRLVSAVRL